MRNVLRKFILISPLCDFAMNLIWVVEFSELVLGFQNLPLLSKLELEERERESKDERRKKKESIYWRMGREMEQIAGTITSHVNLYLSLSIFLLY